MRKSLLVLISLIVLVIGCGRDSQQDANSKIKSEAIPVKVVKAEETTITETIKITGEIAPLWQVDVFPRVNGKVISESVALGSIVRNGQGLAEVLQDIPGMDFSPVKIEATNDGIITMDAVEVGATVSVQRAVYTISEIRRVYMVARVIESLLGKIKTGDVAVVEVDAFPGEKFPGKIAEISPVVDRFSRTAELKIILDNPNLRLKPGMFAWTYLTVGGHQGIVVTLDSIVRTGARSYIYRVENGKARQISIEMGVISKDRIEVRGPLQAGDQIVVLGQNLLEDGVAVSIVEEF